MKRLYDGLTDLICYFKDQLRVTVNVIRKIITFKAG